MRILLPYEKALVTNLQYYNINYGTIQDRERRNNPMPDGDTKCKYFMEVEERAGLF